MGLEMASILRKGFVFLCQNRLKCVCVHIHILFSHHVFSWIRSLWGAKGICIYVTFGNGLWLWNIHSCEANAVLKVFLLCFPPPTLAGGAFALALSSEIPWKSGSWIQLFLFVFLITVLQCKHLQKHVDSIPWKTWSSRGIHMYGMKFSLHWSQKGFFPLVAELLCRSLLQSVAISC